ncbi:MAG: alpha/beta fold hydrolase [Gemmataceae bacterium]
MAPRRSTAVVVGETPRFQPLPFFSGPHTQTILGSVWPFRGCPTGERITVALPDGDALLLHENTPCRWKPGGPVALLVHGLTGSAKSGHSQRLARRLLAAGVRSYRIDLRGAGEGVKLARRTYHAGRSDDLHAALGLIAERCPGSPIGLIAISLGGNIALKAAAEGGLMAAVAAINPPIDLERCSRRFQRPENRFYERRFVRDLIANVQQRREAFPDLPAYPLDPKMSLRSFDDHYTAPVNGFRDAADYYARSSSAPLLERIKISALLLTARDDPFVDPAPFEEVPKRDNLTVWIVPQGGHVGFVDAWGGRWAERLAAEWLLGQFRHTPLE